MGARKGRVRERWSEEQGLDLLLQVLLESIKRDMERERAAGAQERERCGDGACAGTGGVRTRQERATRHT